MDFAAVNERYQAHLRTIRGVVRTELATIQLAQHLPEPPCDVLDIGSGAGEQGLRLAASGHRVTLLDPDPAVLRAATDSAAAHGSEIAARVDTVVGSGEDAVRHLPQKTFDIVLCHGVLMYVEKPEPILRSALRLLREGGILSVITKNREALAMRAGLRSRFRQATELLGSDRGPGQLGVTTRGDTVDGLAAALVSLGGSMMAWYGIRVFTDHLEDDPADAILDEVIAAEELAGRTDPYRRVAPLVHIIATREVGS